jgi:hypothetical protein
MNGRIGAIVAVGVMGASLALAVGTTRAAETVKRFTADKGAKTIDVASYPAAMQDVYNTSFSKRCKKCHTLARPINTNFAPSRWEEYIKKMMRKKGSNVNGEEGKKIWEFLVFDTKQRKSEFWAKLPEREKAVGEMVGK